MLRYVKNGMLLLSVAYIVIGMLLLIMPETSLLWASSHWQSRR